MRTNLPVTGREHRLDPDVSLVSVTDLKGRITYCNPAFIEASGFDVNELLGQPHNLVRHPDMPEEAFRDLWGTVQSGLPWQGVVKNRRKDGDHYWVRANVTPMRAGNGIVGFLSVRSVPARDEVAQVETLYARMRDGAQRDKRSLRLRHGHLVRGDLQGRVWNEALTQVRRWGVDGLVGLALMLVAGFTGSLLPPLWRVPACVALAAAAWYATYARREAQLKTVHDDALNLACGDLVHRPTTGGLDRLGVVQQAIAQIGMNMRAAIGDIRREIESVRGAAAEIASGNQDLSARTEAQAASLEQTAASMEEINGTVRSTAGHAASGAQIAADSELVTERSRSAVQGAVAAMRAIDESSRRISDIVKAIEGIAFQTNILALNAAVEAARAGESGRGFAVVATEVRTLANRTAEAVTEIRHLIAEATERIAGGVTQTDAADGAMREAMEAVRRVGESLSQINTAAGEQEVGVSQVNEAVTHLDSVTQQNAAMVEQLSASAQALNAQVDVVNRSMQLFRLHDSDRTVAELDAAALRRDGKARTAVSGSGDEAFSLDAAIAAHVQWKTRLRNGALKGERFDVDTVCRDDACPLGRWIHGDGQRQWAHLPNFTTLRERHATFHQEVGKVARQINGGDQAGALKALEGGTAYANATQATVLAIKALKQDSEVPAAVHGSSLSSSAARGVPLPTPDRRTAQHEDWAAF